MIETAAWLRRQLRRVHLRMARTESDARGLRPTCGSGLLAVALAALACEAVAMALEASHKECR